MMTSETDKMSLLNIMVDPSTKLPRPHFYISAIQKMLPDVDIDDSSLLSLIEAFEAILKASTLLAESACRMKVRESDVRYAANHKGCHVPLRCGGDLRRKKKAFYEFTRQAMLYACNLDLPIQGKARTVLQVVWEGLEFGSVTSAPAAIGGRTLTLDSPVGVTANIFQMELDEELEAEGDEEDDDEHVPDAR